MEEQYTYYTPEQENPESSRGLKEPDKKKDKKKMGGAKWIICLSMAVVFGVVASGVFTVSNFVLTNVMGVPTKQSQSKQVSTTKVSSGGSTVTTDVTEVVESAMPSVVSITNMSVKQVRDWFGGTYEQESEGSGSGIIIGQNDTELLIVTNNHVIEGNKTLTVTFIDEQSVEASVKGTDANSDIAVIAVPLKNISDETMNEIKVAQLGDSESLKVGEPVIAIGNALGYGQSVTTGVVSATNRTIDMDDLELELIQTDAAINPGNSGGALLNSKGEVIGINTAKLNAEAVESMGYAIPISDINDNLNELMNRETRTKVDESQRGALGVTVIDVTDESSEMYNMPKGVYISEVSEGGGAEKAGFTKGMIITKLDGTSISDKEELVSQLEYYKRGEKVTVTVQAPNGSGEYKEQEVQVTLGEAVSQQK